jgi:hypothetical protein
MMYVPTNFQVTNDEVDTILNSLEDDYTITWNHLLMIDYVYHNTENDYDGGLSFFDRLNKKIGLFNPNWDIDEFKKTIREHANPTEAYATIVRTMLKNQEDINYYGI